jgi:hypothetical protein
MSLRVRFGVRAGERLKEISFGRGLFDHAHHEVEERPGGVCGVYQRAGLAGELRQSAEDDRFEQNLFGGEMAVDGADADAGTTGDLFQRHRRAVCGEGLACGL